VTRIVRTSYHCKRPLRRKKPVALEVPAVVTAKKQPPPPIGEKAAAEQQQLAPVSMGMQGAVQPSTSQKAERVAPAAVLTIRRQATRIIPPGLLADTPEEHRRRGDAADAMWRELVRRVREE
jgi:hypothetical protein